MTRVVLITGASSGIGRAAALAFARAGYHVAGLARRAERLAQLADEVAALPMPHGDFLAVVGDVTQGQDVQAAVQRTLERFGRLDVLVANAGLGQRGALIDADWQHIETVMRTNMDGVLHAVRAAVPVMRQSGGGHLLIISSVAASLISPYAATYAASKAFVSSIAQSLRIELADDHIRVTDFLVGRTETEFDEKRLGAGKRSGGGLPTMSADAVAAALVRTAFTARRSVTLRFFDRLILLGNRLIPGIMGELAKRQYQ